MEEILDNSILDAPKIVVTPPGPKSLEILKQQEELETSALNYPKYFRIAVKEAKGSTIVDLDNNIYIDWFAGISVVNLGHNNPIVRQAVESQLDKIWHYMEIPTEIRIEFMKTLRKTLNFDAKFLFTTTGADAVEAAVKIARWNTGKRYIIAFNEAYHGVTAGTVGLSNLITHKKFQPYYDSNVIKIPYPYEYRCPFKDCLNEVLSLVEYEIKNNDVAGVIVEPVAGEGGYIVPPRGFLKGLREITAEHNLPLIIDEIQTGVGRTGKIWAYEWEGIKPDIVTISKAIGEGIPISLVAFNKDLDKLPQGFHLGTYRGNPIGMAVGNATLNYLMNSNILERVITLGEYIKKRFNEIMEDNYKRGRYDVRGLGFMIGIEFANDQNDPINVKQYIDILLKKGVIMYKAGIYDNVLRYMAPLTIPKLLIDRGLNIFEDVVKSSN